MECNRDEAIRAKSIAETKMLNDDFEGAKKIALKAKNLFPDLENISQLLTVCDVHCSAQNITYGSEKDWYGILQIERFADEATVKKQYRRLALVLHPDKNKYPGAEAAFKLICEANRVLSDKGRKSLYDMKCRSSVRNVVSKPPSHPVNPNFRNSHGAQLKTPNVSTNQFNGFNQNQQTQPLYANGLTFWTICPICSTKYQYLRDYVNRSLRCQSCAQPFIAYDIGSQGPVPVSRQTNTCSGRTTQAAKRCQPTASEREKVPEKSNRTGAETSKNKVKDSNVNTEDDTVGVGMSKIDTTKAKQKGKSRNKNKRRKFVNSSGSNDMMSTSDGEKEEVAKNHTGKQNSGPDGTNFRRSSRLKQNVTYNENALDEGFMTSVGKSCDGKDEQKEPLYNQDKTEAIFTKETTGIGSDFAKGSSHHEDVNYQSYVKEDDPSESTANKYSHSTNSTSEPEVHDCPEAEFTDFDKNKDEKSFSVGQIWACYDTVDSQPRFYALIKKVLSPGFKLMITWLEADPQSKDEVNWVEEDLPWGCGNFVLGETDKTSDRLTFSHKICFQKGVRRGSYRIYPRSGEIWALFKDWDIKWSCDSENHKKYVYEIVEILSDFGDDASGIKVSYLTRLKGFVSLFKRARGAVECLIPSGELLRFSHLVPSSRMTGAEREGVPEGSFELDPAALPTEPGKCWQPEVVDSQRMDVKENGSSPKRFDENSKFTNGHENKGTPKKFVGFEVNFEKVAKVQRSPRVSKMNIKLQKCA